MYGLPGHIKQAKKYKATFSLCARFPAQSITTISISPKRALQIFSSFSLEIGNRKLEELSRN